MATPGSLPPGIPPKPKPNGFEIAVDQAETDGSNLKPKIVDVFHICNR